jgi:hypothetical protein
MKPIESKFDAELLHARWVLGGVEPIDLVRQAILAIEQGFSGTELAILAGLDLPSRRDIGSLPERVFAELGLAPMDKEQALKVIDNRGAAFSNALISELVGAFPGFEPRWTEHVTYWNGNPAGSYIDMAEFVHYVVEDVYEKGALSEVQRVFDWMDQALSKGDQEARNLISLGFFETLQCVASWGSYGRDAFEQFLGPNSRIAWEELKILWRGKSSLADVIRAENEENR